MGEMQERGLAPLLLRWKSAQQSRDRL